MSEVKQNDSLKITATSALNYPARRIDQIQTANNTSSGKIVASSKSTQIILGDRVKSTDNTNSSTEDVSYLIMVLAYEKNNQNKDSNEMVSMNFATFFLFTFDFMFCDNFF